ncbi:hypothetical protein IF1G_06237 [Cordyceps javanica]|uniref:Uncharacterized protein n=1 Tax=Cordyceps javanica TaxID=43265 RepID=A0A545V0K7_9HYPO|nr:hypothetical protein IF1G_06237 [Cordyceps javanica]
MLLRHWFPGCHLFTVHRLCTSSPHQSCEHSMAREQALKRSVAILIGQRLNLAVVIHKMPGITIYNR